MLHNGTPMIGIIDQCVLNERWVGIAGKESTLNGIPIKTDGVPTLSDAEIYSTTPDMFQPGDALIKFNTMKGAHPTTVWKLCVLDDQTWPTLAVLVVSCRSSFQKDQVATNERAVTVDCRNVKSTRSFASRDCCMERTCHRLRQQ